MSLWKMVQFFTAFSGQLGSQFLLFNAVKFWPFYFCKGRNLTSTRMRPREEYCKHIFFALGVFTV